MGFDPYTAEDIFQCKMCGDCCEGYGGTYLTGEDVKMISEYIGTSEDTFVETYCDISGGRPVITRGEDGKCIFFKSLCTIHPVKPRMCRAWPFIESVIKDISNWKIMGTACPGIKTDVPDDVIKKYVSEELTKLDKKR
ncbi:MAG: YkgJ family cysteine cluster protein [Proteobacteria bacterium]|nr:YkgJ family cysteine cluster protein [Pseudomonadota bacterium]